MNNRFTRIMARWFKTHPTYGIVPMCAAIAMDAGDEAALGVGDSAARLPVTVYNDVDDACMFPRYNPTIVPALGLVSQGSGVAPVVRLRGQLTYDSLEIAIAYLEKDTDELLAKKRGDYVLQAATDSLLAFIEPRFSDVGIPDDTNGDTWRSLGGKGNKGAVEVIDIPQIEQFKIKLGVHGVTMFGALIATCKVRRMT